MDFARKGFTTKISMNATRKAEILAEEQYRMEIRRQIEDKKHVTLDAWTFVNSSFGLWLLSTVVIGLISFSYTKYQSNKEKILEEYSYKKKMLMEIEARAHEIVETLNETQDEVENSILLGPNHLGLYEASIKKLQTDFLYYHSVYAFPEFEKRTLRSISTEYYIKYGGNNTKMISGTPGELGETGNNIKKQIMLMNRPKKMGIGYTKREIEDLLKMIVSAKSAAHNLFSYHFLLGNQYILDSTQSR